MNDLFDNNNAGAVFSEDGKYRYALWRKWDCELPLVMCIGLNPSTASYLKNDATINILRRTLCKLGYGGFYMVNCFPQGIRDNGHSTKDIDLYFPELDGEEESIILLAKLLGLSTTTDQPSFVRTVVGGMYFYSKIFGDVDCFFKQHIKEYCEKFWKENP